MSRNNLPKVSDDRKEEKLMMKIPNVHIKFSQSTLPFIHFVPNITSVREQSLFICKVSRV